MSKFLNRKPCLLWEKEGRGRENKAGKLSKFYRDCSIFVKARTATNMTL
jgi:hypothetical protein